MFSKVYCKIFADLAFSKKRFEEKGILARLLPSIRPGGANAPAAPCSRTSAVLHISDLVFLLESQTNESLKQRDITVDEQMRCTL